MNLTALESFDMVWDRKGWHIAKYRSTVKPVMVKTVAFPDVSASSPLKKQKTPPKI